MNHITVTWMDGKQETYVCDWWEVANGLLWLRLDPATPPAYCVPLNNVRVWTVT